MRRNMLIFIVMTMIYVVGTEAADQSRGVNFQGRLLSTEGLPINGSVTVDVTLFNDSVSGEMVYFENIGSISVQNGLYAFQWGSHGSSIVTRAETVAVTDGNAATFTNMLQMVPVIQYTVAITDGTYEWNDATGSSHPSEFVCGIDHESGFVSVFYPQGAPSSGIVVSASYDSLTHGLQPALLTQSNLWLQTSINSEPLDPRTELMNTPFAGVACSIQGENIYVDGLTGNVGIHTTNPQAMLHVNGEMCSKLISLETTLLNANDNLTEVNEAKISGNLINLTDNSSQHGMTDLRVRLDNNPDNETSGLQNGHVAFLLEVCLDGEYYYIPLFK